MFLIAKLKIVLLLTSIMFQKIYPFIISSSITGPAKVDKSSRSNNRATSADKQEEEGTNQQEEGRRRDEVVENTR